MNDDQLYYFLVDKNTRNVLQIEYPSDIDEFNKILGTSEGKGSLLKDLGIILNSDTVVFKNPEQVTKSKNREKLKEANAPTTKKQSAKKSNSNKKVKISTENIQSQGNLFAGLFD